jgi:hypothetical protein
MLENRTGAMSMQGMLHLVGKNPGELFSGLGLLNESTKDNDVSARRRKGIYYRIVHYNHLEGIGIS